MLKVGIVGATGYAGEELIKILARHSNAKLTYLAAKIDKTVSINHVFPELRNKIDLACHNKFDLAVALREADFFFLALPHRLSMEIAPKLLSGGKKVIDLSADYRLENVSEYKRWYGVTHKDKSNIKKAVYGLPEIYQSAIKKTSLTANPGCYPTSVILGLLPLLKQKLIDTKGIIIDSKSGVSGAGRESLVVKDFHNGIFNAKPYKIGEHQHIPEIEQELSKIASKAVNVLFTPQVIPIERGILTTIYVKLKKILSDEKIIALYGKVYNKQPFVKVLGKGMLPEIKNVTGTNYCQIGIKADKKNNIAVIISAIDNLIKGASGQAVQNMNIMCGFNEKEALV